MNTESVPDPDTGAPSRRERDLIEAARKEVLASPGARTARPGQPGQPGQPPIGDLPGYEITREIHRGGQGVVYEATETSTRRKVALKVLREGPFAGPSDRARFEREVQILGRLSHPHIVAIHDSGEAAGHFYYAMDYIRGRPLDAWLAGRLQSGVAPDLGETVRLFAKICEAVDAAHLRGVIHRDLKPGNLLIDEDGEPHVVDFGMAKVAPGERADGADSGGMTITGQFVGSLPWASPEQARGLEIDLRTDVYSLGVVLYQMLTARFPYEVIGSPRDVIESIQRAEPMRPSTVRDGPFAGRLDDELETIVLKCLKKERERRYQSAGDLARDVRRHLAGEPIEARRDSVGYVLRKLIGRHRVLAASAAAIVVLLCGFAVAMSVLYGKASRAENAAVEQRTRAAREASARRAAFHVLEAIVGPDFGMALPALDPLVREVDLGFADQPGIQANLRYWLAVALGRVGRLDEAITQGQQALDAQLRLLGPDHRDTLQSMDGLAFAHQINRSWDQAERLSREVVETARRTRPDSDPDVIAWRNRLAVILRGVGKLQESFTIASDLLPSAERAFGVEDQRTLSIRYNVIEPLLQDGRHAEAERIASAWQRQNATALGADHAATANALSHLERIRLAPGVQATAAAPREASAPSRSQQAQPQDPASQRIVVLENGITLLMHPVAGTGQVCLEACYRVGFMDEPKGMTQAAHLIEHLVCHGATASFEPGAAMAALAQKGMANAETLPDWTHYDACVPPSDLELALQIEAERLTSLRITQPLIDQEAPRCYAETAFVERNPQAGMLKHAFMALNQSWRHGQDEALVRGGLAELPIPALEQFHRACYRPDSLTLVLVGEFEPEAAIGLVRKHLGAITLPAAERLAPIDWSKVQKRATVAWDSKAEAVCLAYPPPADATERVVLSLWGAMLMPKLAADPAITAAAHMSFCSMHTWSVGDLPFFVYATRKPGVAAEDLERCLNTRLESVLAEEPREHELEQLRGFVRMLSRTTAGLDRRQVEAQAERLPKQRGQDRQKASGMVMAQIAINWGVAHKLLGPQADEHVRKIESLTAAQLAEILRRNLDAQRRIATAIAPKQK